MSLDRSEQPFYRLLLDSTQDWETFTDPDGRFVYSSPSIEHVLGVPFELMTDPAGYFARVHPDDLEIVHHHAESEEARNTGGMTFRFLGKDGRYRWISHICGPVYDADGTYLGRRGSNRDVTAQKETEIALASRIQMQQAVSAVVEELMNLEPSQLEDGIVHALELVGNLTRTDRVTIHRFGLQPDTLEVAYVWSSSTAVSTMPQQYKQTRVASLPWARATLARGERLLCRTLDELPEEATEERVFFSSLGLQSILMLPLTFRNTCFGSLTMTTYSGVKDWETETIGVAGSIANLISGFFFRREHEAGIERQLRTNEAVLTILKELVTLETPALDTGIVHALELLGELAGVDRATIQRFDPAPDAITLTHQWNSDRVSDFLPQRLTTISTTHMPWLRSMLDRGEMIILDHLDAFPKEAEAEHAFFSRLGARALLIAPIARERKVIGGLAMAMYQPIDGWSTDTITLAKVFAEMVSGFIYRKLAAESLERSELRWQFAVEGGGDGLWDWDIEHDSFWVSEQYHTILGYHPGELRSSPEMLKTLIHPDDHGSIERGTHTVLESRFDSPHEQSAFAEEVRMKTGDGVWKWVLCRGMCMSRNADGSPSRMIGTISDITVRKAHEQKIVQQAGELRNTVKDLEQALLAKGTFLSTMNHELRTPLTSILSATEVLEMQQSSLTERQMHFVRMIRSDGRHLLSMISDVLDYTRLDSGSVELDLIPASVTEAAASVVRELAGKAQAGNVAMLMSCEEPRPIVHADAGRLRQMILNLVDNAVKFSPDGGEVRISICADSNPGFVRIEVRDTGIGISESDMRRLFQPFGLVDESNTRPHKGTGLGLALVSRLAELQGGSLSAESTPGRGSTFCIRLPRG